MSRLFLLLCYLISVHSTCQLRQQNIIEYPLVINSLTKGGINEWYIVHEQFINKDCTNRKKNASTYLSTKRGTGDTVWVISPCVKNSFKKDSGAALFIDEGLKIGDTVYVKIPQAYSSLFRQRKNIVFGTLKVPMQ